LKSRINFYNRIAAFTNIWAGYSRCSYWACSTDS